MGGWRVPFIAAVALALAWSPAAAGPPLAVIDGHAHLVGGSLRPDGRPDMDWEAAAAAALVTMDRLGLAASVVMPMPFAPGQREAFDAEELAAAVQGRGGRLFFLAGGGSLNPMIQQARDQGAVDPDTRRRFIERAERILALGAAGFGELAAEHLSFQPSHPYMSAPPDHELFLLLADLAARHGVPLDLHMEALAEDAPPPADLTSSNNPPLLRANLAGLERLLSHNRGASIIWAHAGWDNTGRRTAALCRELLHRHPNLYMSLKLDRRRGLSANRPLDQEGRLKPEWRELIGQFPDRFLLGSDTFHLPPASSLRLPQRADGIRVLIDQLPPELAQQVGVENPRRLFRLGP